MQDKLHGISTTLQKCVGYNTWTIKGRQYYDIKCTIGHVI